jgi:hypothetical protein
MTCTKYGIWYDRREKKSVPSTVGNVHLCQVPEYHVKRLYPIKGLVRDRHSLTVYVLTVLGLKDIYKM